MSKAQSQARNFFDELGADMDPAETMRMNKEREAQAAKLDYLVHKVFAQNEEGAELLKIWQEAMMLRPVAVEGNDLLSIGLRQGRLDFIRGIIMTINKVEGS